jgi:SAM-dependent methyltransferase
MDVQTWNDRYRASELIWSAGPNQFVESICADLEPGRAIDLAAGEGRNAIWLAEQGWDATALDFSDVAIDKARQLAERRGVTITADVADLNAYVPTPGGYDLVLVAYLQIPDEQLTPILRRAAAAVAPGGTFLLISHDLSNLDGGYGGPQAPDVLTTPEQVVAAVGDELEVRRAEVVERRVSTDDGERTALDTLVVAGRPT